jgi:hypothetical protein
MAELLLSRDGHAYKSRVVWAGEYAEGEEETEAEAETKADEEDDEEDPTLRGIALDSPRKEVLVFKPPSPDTYRYIVNHDLRQFVDKQRLSSRIHPLPLLTAEGNGCGGGDYRGSDMDKVGMWARAPISVEKALPDAAPLYAELVVDFRE